MVRMKKIIVLLIVLICINSPAFTQEDKLSFDVSVQSQILPFFVTDKAGNPVYNLKKEDFKLIVNGKETSITDLIDHKFYEQNDISVPVEYKKKTPIRYVF